MNECVMCKMPRPTSKTYKVTNTDGESVLADLCGICYMMVKIAPRVAIIVEVVE